MKKIIIALFTLLLFQNCCFSAEWKEVSYKTYIDMSSWHYKNGYSYAWVKSLNDGTKKPINGQQVWFSLNKFKIDCTNGKLGIVNYIDYGLKGQVLDSFTPVEINMFEVAPESRGEILHEYVCGKRTYY